MKLSATPVLALVALLPTLGIGLGLGPGAQEGTSQEGPLRTGEGGIETGTGIVDPLTGEEIDRPDDRPDVGTGIGNTDFGNYDVFGRRSKTRANTLGERLLGGWRLVEMQLDGYDSRGRIAQGFLHVGPGFLSMELHAAWDDETDNSAIPDSDIHTAFTADYRVEGDATLHCTTIIGSYIDDETNELQWERAGYEREFSIRETGKELTLFFGQRGETVNRLTFEPYLPAVRGQRDIFGRRPLNPAIGETDIFGRQRPTQTGDRDIYGRVKPGEPEAEAGTEGEEGGTSTGGEGAERTGASYPLRGRSGNR